MTTFKHPSMSGQGIRIADKYTIQVWNGRSHLETIGTPGHPVWGKPMSRSEARRKIDELRRTNKYPAEYNLIPVKI